MTGRLKDKDIQALCRISPACAKRSGEIDGERSVAKIVHGRIVWALALSKRKGDLVDIIDIINPDNKYSADIEKGLLKTANRYTLNVTFRVPYTDSLPKFFYAIFTKAEGILKARVKDLYKAWGFGYDDHCGRPLMPSDLAYLPEYVRERADIDWERSLINPGKWHFVMSTNMTPPRGLEPENVDGFATIEIIDVWASDEESAADLLRALHEDCAHVLFLTYFWCKYKEKRENIYNMIDFPRFDDNDDLMYTIPHFEMSFSNRDRVGCKANLQSKF